jgi:hypothetical protein
VGKVTSFHGGAVISFVFCVISHSGDALGGVGEPGNDRRWAAVSGAPRRWESSGVERSWFSP